MVSDLDADEKRDFRIVADIAELRALCESVHEFLGSRGLSSKTLFTVEFVLEELITNIVKYAGLDAGGKITVCVGLTHRQVTLVIEDDGRPFDPAQSAEPDVDQPLDQRDVGGLGLCLTRRMVQSLRYERRETTNHLEIGIDRLSE